jgi:hypothetical protein
MSDPTVKPCTLSLFLLTDAPPEEIGEDGSECYCWLAVWAADAAEALACGMAEWARSAHEPECALQVMSSSQGNGLASPTVRGAHVERRTSVHRQLGWRCDGDDVCDTCGLYEMDSEGYRVCEGCQQCRECGCMCDEYDTKEGDDE